MSKCAMRWAVVIVTVSVILSLENTNHGTLKDHSWFISRQQDVRIDHHRRLLRQPVPSPVPSPAIAITTELEYDFYRNKCPNAEKIIRFTVNDLFHKRVGVAPSLLRLLFHDCFVQGCDASVLLDSVPNGERSEKEALPNLGSLKGFDMIDIIKTNVEKECPETVSCADIIAIAARDAVAMAGGPYFPVSTGRRDSFESLKDNAEQELPNPFFNLSTTLNSFAKKGFNERETVSLLGGHSVGTVHCRFIHKRLYNFSNNRPDESLDAGLRELLKSLCDNSTSPNDEGTAIPIDHNSNSSFVGQHYYQNLLIGFGVLYADQQLTSGDSSLGLVQEYAMDGFAFGRDFATAMVKLSELNVLSGSQGQVRVECSKVVTTPNTLVSTPSPA